MLSLAHTVAGAHSRVCKHTPTHTHTQQQHMHIEAVTPLHDACADSHHLSMISVSSEPAQPHHGCPYPAHF